MEVTIIEYSIIIRNIIKNNGFPRIQFECDVQTLAYHMFVYFLFGRPLVVNIVPWPHITFIEFVLRRVRVL